MFHHHHYYHHHHAENVPWTMCLPTLIAQAISFLECGQSHTDRQTNTATDSADHCTHTSANVNVGNNGTL